AKPLDRIVTSLRFYSTAQNALRKAGITSPTYIYGSVADLLASKGSDVDLLLVSEGDWDEIERKLPQFHLAFVTPKYLQNLDSFFIYSILRRGVPLISGVEIADASFDPKKLLAEALQTYETAWADGRAYEPQLLDAAGLAAKYILYQKGILPPTSSIGAIFELAKVDENYLGVFRNLEVRPIEDTAKEVIGWARKTR
ncbi:MAG: hypothetical protein QMD00_06285, partial [Hadesarchaea archaeon]|nr:hypothetical protein [Hadesarchaea archaeon]